MVLIKLFNKQAGYQGLMTQKYKGVLHFAIPQMGYWFSWALIRVGTLNTGPNAYLRKYGDGILQASATFLLLAGFNTV